MKIRTHKELEVYKLAFESAMKIFEISKSFPKEETYSLTDQMRRSSRSVCSNLAEAFRKRRYPKAFISKLSDSEGESAETQTWIDFAASCQYITSDIQEELNSCYEKIIGKLINMSLHPENWSWETAYYLLTNDFGYFLFTHASLIFAGTDLEDLTI